MKKIGILVNPTLSNTYLNQVIRTLSQDSTSEVILLYTQLNNTSSLVFRVFANIESFLNTILYVRKQHNSHLNTPINYSEFTCVNVDSTADIQNMHLDLIVDMGLFTIPEEIFQCSKEGVLQLKITPYSAFWSVYNRQDTMNFRINLLQSTSQNNLLEGNIATKKTYTETISHAYSTSYYYIQQIISLYINNQKLAYSHTDSIDDNIKEFRTPTVIDIFFYILKTIKLIISKLVQKYILRQRDEWAVAFIQKNWEDIDLSQGIKINNPTGTYFADPFVIEKNHRTICYVEEYIYSQSKGIITAIELFTDNSYTILGPVIEEDFHMSYPFILEYQNEIYMIPETGSSNSIRLYKALDFPLKWEYQKDILIGQAYRDTTIIPYKEHWYLMTNTDDLALHIYVSDNPIDGEWKSISQLPVVLDARTSRNGGIVYKDNSPIRVRQRQSFNLYGAGLSLAQITQLTPDMFQEDLIQQIEPHFFPHIKGCHQLHSNGKFTVYDYLESRSISS